MKFIMALVLLVLTSTSFAKDRQTLSKVIANNYQMMIDELAPGNYNSVVSISYLYQIGSESSGTLPVLLSPKIEVNVPLKMKDCLENDGSIACNLATAAYNWYDTNRPTNGQFQINLQLGGKTKEISFPIN